MNWLEAVILGFIQGLTEFLPISSTGHLYIGRHLFGLEEAGLFLDTMLHLGTLLALLFFYRGILIKLLKNPFNKLTFLLIIGTIPSIVIGLSLKDYFEEISTTGVTIGWEFLITGTFLWYADMIKKGEKKLEDIRVSDAFMIGVFQAAAIFPAISRSGMTIVGALIRKIDKETAAYFSFLLSIPAIFGAVSLQSIDLVKNTHHHITFLSLFFASVSSALFGYLAVKWMIHYVKKHSLKVFAGYVWILGLLIITLQSLGIW
ncbi:undecaprenyl-diphosphate phosphatase [Bacillus taeanensis]|uniref:Undecaprenyl-diphosphatase n=1 Tax=Bacillus taeanensis TaxID=273032 RepID=A0A366XV43_9BACI|nr:undecaprenyl-diphosphate phosphatase [Bacillus taeanensis]RBW68004.1 undecaprenyl-diphosphatase [Bacillus taeanensis]